MISSEILDRCVLWESTTAKTLGMIMIIFSIILVFPVAAAVYFSEDVMLFLPMIPVLAIVGSFMFIASGRSSHFRMANAIVMMTMAWALMFSICAAPFYHDGMTLLDAMYESVSGFTTTGMSAMGDLDDYPVSLLMWRSLTQWIGGITIVVIFLYFLPSIGFGRGVFKNELSGSGSSLYTGRVTDAARSFIVMYSALTAVNLLLLILVGVRPFESLCLALTTVSTGGLMIVNSNMMAYSDAVQWITILFMILGGVNFYLHYKALVLREKGVYRRNSEFKTMLLWFSIISIIVFLLYHGHGIINGTDEDSIYTSVKNTLFTVVSLGTTSGFYVEDYTLWPSQCTLLLMVVAFIGASSGSTSGGMKFSRVLIIYQYIKNGFRRILNPNAVYAVKIDRQSMDDETIQSAIVVSMTYMLTMGIGAIILMILGFNTVDGFGLSIAAISNGGSAFGNYGPLNDITTLTPSVKMALIVMMWIGRLEIITALMIFTPGFWRDLWLNSHAVRASKKRSMKD